MSNQILNFHYEISAMFLQILEGTNCNTDMFDRCLKIKIFSMLFLPEIQITKKL